jgi:hypothetical protein
VAVRGVVMAGALIVVGLALAALGVFLTLAARRRL